jgi:hypothetical protein
MERRKFILLKIEHRMMESRCPNIINRGIGGDGFSALVGTAGWNITI